MTDRLLMFLGAGHYLVALAVALLALGRRTPPPRTAITLLLAVGFALQSVGLYLRGMSQGSCPISNPFEVLQFISWSTMLVYWLTGPVFRMTLLGSFSAGLAALLTLLSILFPGWDDRTGAPIFGGNPWIEAHASLALLSYGVFGLLAATSILYLLQNRSLKRKQSPRIFRNFPSIAQLEAVNFRLLLVGVGVLGAAMAIGAVYWIEHWETVSPFKLSITLTLLAAGIVTLGLRAWAGWVGKRLAWTCVGLFLFALLSLWPVELDRAPVAGAPAIPPSSQHG